MSKVRLRTGDLPHRIEIQRPTAQTDSHGGVTQSYFLQTTVWGRIEPLRGSEIFDAQKVDAQVSHRITLRDISTLLTEGLLPNDRLVNDDKGYNLVQVLNLQTADSVLEILAIEDPNFEVEGLWDDEDGNLVSDTDGNNTEWI